MSTSVQERSDDPLDPVRIRQDVWPAAEAAEQARFSKERRLKAGLTVAALLTGACLLTPVFKPLDVRPDKAPSINSDEVILFTDPPGATVALASLTAGGNGVGSTGRDPIPLGQLVSDPNEPGKQLDSRVLYLSKPGYVPQQQVVTPLDLSGGIWPQKNQRPVRLMPENPAVFVLDYLRNYRPGFFWGLCLGAAAGAALAALMVAQARWTARREKVRQGEKSHDNLTGISVLGYEIVSRLGSGATSLVYRGLLERDLETERAVRFTRLAEVTDKDVESFRRETGLYQKMSHDHIVRAYDFERFDNTFVTVMELIEGSSLEKEFGPGRPMARERLVPVFSAIAEGLDYAHSKGVIHRDLKPANVMLRLDGSPVLVDFGMATDLNVTKITQTGVIKGTLAYISPEQISGASKVGAPADQFAFGMMLYEALSGASPNDAEDPSRLLMERIYGTMKPLADVAPNLPAGVVAAVTRMVAVKAEDRFPTIGEGMAEVQRALAG